MPTPTQRQSLGRHAIMAVLLMIGFYAMALVIVLLLLFSIVAQLYGGQIFIWLAFMALIGAVAIIIAVFPRPDRFNPPWPERATPTRDACSSRPLGTTVIERSLH